MAREIDHECARRGSPLGRCGCVLGLAAGAILSAVGCEPDALLGVDTVLPTKTPVPMSQGGSQGPEDLDDPRIIDQGGEGGAGGAAGEPERIFGHVCPVSHPGETHDEPIAVCCVVEPEEQAWSKLVMEEINQVRVAADLPELEPDPLLDSTALAWAMHWSVHWDPVAKSGYPGSGYSPRQVAESCGTTAQVIMATNAQDESQDAAGLIDPSFPADYWKNDSNLSRRLLDPDYKRLGVATYDGLLVGILSED